MTTQGLKDKAEKLSKIATTPREIDILQTRKRKLEHKMWASLLQEEKEEYVRLHSAIKKEASGDLEKELKEFYRHFPFPWGDFDTRDREYIGELCRGVARHFAKWGAVHLKR